ncbi:hypothetical protein CR513_16404, partial [Mucuna pruriens]
MTKEEWVRKLDEATERSIRWYLPWNERQHIIIKCEGYPNVPLLGTQGAINYNPELAVRQAGYPMIMPPPDEVMTPFVLHGPEAHKGSHYRKILHAWNNTIKKGIAGKLWSCGASPGYRRWVEERVKIVGPPWVQETFKVEKLKATLEQTKAEKAHLKRKLEEAIEEVCREKHLNVEITQKAQVEQEACLKIGSCLKATDKEICAGRVEWTK